VVDKELEFGDHSCSPCWLVPDASGAERGVKWPEIASSACPAAIFSQGCIPMVVDMNLTLSSAVR
jgi:hypothetical protein